jgi:hypothetical protein
MALTVLNEDGVTIIEAVGDRRKQRGSYDRLIRIDRVGNTIYRFAEIFLMCKIPVNDIAGDLARRRLSLTRRLHLFLIRRVQTLDQKPAEKTTQRRDPLPKCSLPVAGSKTSKKWEIERVRSDEMVQALGDTPAFFARLPVKLGGRQPAERSLHLFRCRREVSGHLFSSIGHLFSAT